MERNNERTLFIAFFRVFPPSGGASQVSFQLGRHWPGIRKVLQTGSLSEGREIEPGLTIDTLPDRGGGERWRKLAAVPNWCRQMAAAASDFVPDTIILEGASWCAYHWWLISQLRRAAPRARLIYHAHNVEYDLRRQKHSRLVAWLTRQAEARVLKTVDMATAVSQVDADRFAALYHRKAALLPNGVDLAWLRNVSEAEVEAIRRRYSLPAKTVLFMGGYAYRPNGEAIDFLVREVFPELLRREPGARLLVLGGETPHSAPWLVAPGLVPAEGLPAFIRTAALSVVPIFSGSGTRLKVIESLAAGVPVVATEKGVEGLPIQAPKDYLRAETATEFVEALATMLASGPSMEAARNDDMLLQLSWPRIVEQARADLDL